MIPVFIFSCQKQNVEPSEISIMYLKQMYRGYPLVITDNIVIYGKVIADNSTPNLSGCIIIEDDTGAIEISVPYDYVSSFIHRGNRVKLRCQGLCLGGYGGVIELGLESTDLEYETSSIDEATLIKHVEVIDTSIDTSPILDELTIGELDASRISSLVKIKNLVLSPEENQLVWCPYTESVKNTYAYDAFGDSIVLRVYDYTNFATSILPSGAIDVEGSVGYFNSYQLNLLDYSYSAD
ncbi:MAG: DUF5689 domain-containing protein [Rikenellaceae bacterium]